MLCVTLSQCYKEHRNTPILKKYSILIFLVNKSIFTLCSIYFDRGFAVVCGSFRNNFALVLENQFIILFDAPNLLFCGCSLLNYVLRPSFCHNTYNDGFL